MDNVHDTRPTILSDHDGAHAPETANDAFIRKGAFVFLALMALLSALAVVGFLYQLIWR